MAINSDQLKLIRWKERLGLFTRNNDDGKYILDELHQARQEYGNITSNLVADNALSDIVREKIANDVEEIKTLDARFHSEEMESMIKRILISWCCYQYDETGEKPYVYSEGLHHILSVILYVSCQGIYNDDDDDDEECIGNTYYDLDVISTMLDPHFFESDIYAMFSRLIIYLLNLYGRALSLDNNHVTDPIICISNFVHTVVLQKLNPKVAEHISQYCASTSYMYSYEWFSSLFTSICGNIENVALLWDEALNANINSVENENENKYCTTLLAVSPTEEHLSSSFPVRIYLAIINSIQDLILSSDSTEQINNYLKIPNDVLNIQEIIYNLKMFVDPYHMELLKSGCKVVKFDEGTLGIVLRRSKDKKRLIVNNFQENADGLLGPAQRSLKINVNDAVLAINSIKIHSSFTPSTFAKHLSSLGRPIYVAFLDKDEFIDKDEIQSRIMQTNTFESSSNNDVNFDLDKVCLYPGETILNSTLATSKEAFIYEFTNILSYAHIKGSLILTNHRLIFLKTREPMNTIVNKNNHNHIFEKNGKYLPKYLERSNSNSPRSLNKDSLFLMTRKIIYLEADIFIPLNLIMKIIGKTKNTLFSSTDWGLEIFCKDGQLLKFNAIDGHVNRFNEFYDKIFEGVKRDPNQYAMAHFNEVAKTQGFDRAASRGKHFHYSLLEEYERLGLKDVLNKKVKNNFQLIDQLEVQLCQSYPRHLILPVGILKTELYKICNYRVKERIPVVTWMDPKTNVTISRTSQPKVGAKKDRCIEDEKLIHRLRVLAPASQASQYFIIDARGKLSSLGNQFIGKGSELIQYYEKVEILFMNISNIHVLRECEFILHQTCRPSQDKSPPFWSRIENSGWITEIQNLLIAALQVVDIISERKSSVLIHCSDGWDRTSQIASLSQLLLDSYYRTLNGFQVLIEKEWIDFGHNFRRRSGLGSEMKQTSRDDNRSPVFVLFIDCVFQLIRQFPTAFEFNEKLLIFLIDQLYTCRYGTFLSNTSKQRHELSTKTISIWLYVDDHLNYFTNEIYDSSSNTQQVLYPTVSSRNISFFESYFRRADYSSFPYNSDNFNSFY